MSTARDIANNLFEKGDYRVALQKYLDIIQEDPKDARAFQRIAQCHYRLRDYNAAVSASLRAIELDQTLAIPHTVLANIYYYQNSDADKALAEALQAFTLSPDIEEVVNCYAALLGATGRVDEAIPILKHTLEINPKSIPLRYNLAVAYNKKRDYKRSLNELEIVFKYKPTLRHGLQLLLAYEQRYAALLTLAFLITLFGSLLLRIQALLVIPLIIVIQGWIIAYSLLRKGSWLAALLLIGGNVLVTTLIYIIYKVY